METQRKKALGFWTLTALVAGNVIGSGVFLLPSALAHFGSIGIISWALVSVGAIALALVFAKLARIHPAVGGPYAYCREAFGDFVGFQVAYNYWIALWVGNAAVVVALVGYVSFFWPAINYNHGLAFFVAAFFLWLITAINVIGMRPAGVIQLVTTILKLIPLFVIAIVGLFFIHPHYLTKFNVSHYSNFGALTAAAALAFWSFVGMESATVPADDVENPTKNIPRATIIGTLIAALIYILGAVAIMGIIPMQVLVHSSSPYSVAAEMIFGGWGGWVIGIGAIIATFGTANGWVLMQGQVPLAAARDNLFPRSFAKTSKNGTPTYGLVASSVLITILLAMNYNESLVTQFTFIILLAVLATLIPYLYTTMAEIIILLKRKEKYPKEKIFKHVFIAIFAFVYISWAIIGVGEKIMFYGALLLLSSVPVYVWMKYTYRR
jgi:basic amino acid/polyamine antiporter, APA family